VSAMGKLIGVECVECRRKGHHCQAQIVVEDEPLCLRCADGEACCYVTGAGFRDGFNFAGADEDDPCQPILPAQPVYHRAHEMRFLPPNYTTTERDRFRCELRYASIAEVAKRHGMEPEMIAQFADPDENPQPKPLSKRAAKKLKAAINRPVRRVIDGEVVRMAPGAVMGPEFLKHKPVSILRIQKTISVYFGISREEMLSRSRSEKYMIPRQIAISLSRKFSGESISEIGRNFKLHNSTAHNAISSIKHRMGSYPELEKKVTEIKTLLLKDLSEESDDESRVMCAAAD